jgi:probable rRNA maturation factor
LKVVVTNRHRALRVAIADVRRLVAALQGARERFEQDNSVLPAAADESELSIVFLDDLDLAALHGHFLNDPSPTDVITFPPAPGSGSAGEICVSVDAARRVAGARGFAAELTLYLVHGWLHLAGHDDLRPDLNRRMRQAERGALALLRTARAMPRFTFARDRR